MKRPFHFLFKRSSLIPNISRVLQIESIVRLRCLLGISDFSHLNLHLNSQLIKSCAFLLFLFKRNTANLKTLFRFLPLLMRTINLISLLTLGARPLPSCSDVPEGVTARSRALFFVRAHPSSHAIVATYHVHAVAYRSQTLAATVRSRIRTAEYSPSTSQVAVA